jgi:spore coat polysaccharide biosynthesis protein SpsF
MRVVAIVQARMGSTRLPGKVLKDIGGDTMLARVVRRTLRASLLNQTVVATTAEPSDDAIVAECKRLEVPVFRGDEQDVLDRYYQAAREYEAEVVVRITSDCPFIDPEMVDQVMHAFLEEKPDYAGNTLVRAYPRGVIPEVMAMSALTQAWREASEAYQRVHVTPYIYQHPRRFRLLAVMGEADYGDHRWTVDTPEDLEFARAVYACLGNNDAFSWLDMLSVLAQKPELMELNRCVKQKPLEEG